jgi:hypothetical protein
MLLAGSFLTLAAVVGATALSGASERPVNAVHAAGSGFTAPADGRLRGKDFAAIVTAVAWPDQVSIGGKTQEATTGRRFVEFTVQLAEDPSTLGLDNSAPAVTAALLWGGSSHPISLTTINDAIAQQQGGSTWPSSSGRFVATVPNTSHAVDLVISEGSFSQDLNLWTLKRMAPAPTVLYRDANLPTLSGTGASPTTIALTNPADGFSSTAQVSLQGATLSDFPPNGAGGAPSSPTEAVLNVLLDAEHPDNPNDLTGSGHYLGAQTPVPGTMVSFTPTGGAPIAATISGASDTSGKGNSDDGLFDATYSFVVPATMTNGTLTVNAGSFSGDEFTLYTPESGNTTLNITAPANMAVSLPAVPAAAVQKKPPWVGQPLPPTVAATSPTGTVPSPTPGFPIWVAVLILAAAATVIVVLQRRWARRPSAAAVVSAAAAVTTTLPVDKAPDEPINPASPVASTPSPVVVPVSSDALVTNFLGPPEVHGLRQTSERRIVEALLYFLVLHDIRPLSADQIKLAIWPTEGVHPEVNRGTFHSYLSTLRRCIGAEHLPDAASIGGYQIRDVISDWATFQELNRQADGAVGAAAIALRTQALGLVRGKPFEGADDDLYRWVVDEHFFSMMTVAIAACAMTLATDHFAAADYTLAEAAARLGLLGAPDDFALWQIGAQAIDSRADTTALRRWMADAARHLGPDDLARTEVSLPSHSPSPE